jgi:hypothetical protein
MQRSDLFATLVAAFVLGAGAYLSTYPIEVIRVVGIVLMAASLWGLIVWFLWERRPKAVPAILLYSGITFAVLSAVSLGIWYFLPSKISKTETGNFDNAIGIACSWSKPPTRYREDKTLHIVDFQGVPISGVDFSRQSAGPMHFIRSSDPFTPPEHHSDMWYRCDVTNHSSQPIRNLWTKFPVVYNAVVRTENGTRSGEMIAAGFARSPMFDLAAGETDYFYFANASAAFVTVLPPSSASLQTMADDAVYEVRVVASAGWQVALMPSPKPLNANPEGIEDR